MPIRRPPLTSALRSTLPFPLSPVSLARLGPLQYAVARSSLAAEEAAGGHTIARHVGRTEAQLRARLAQQANIPAASTFKTLQEAERAVAAALRANKEAIKIWAKTANPGQTKAFAYDAGRIIGKEWCAALDR